MTGRVHRYRVHGLVVESEIDFPELDPEFDGTPPDIVVALGKVPSALSDLHFDGAWAQAARGAFLLRVPGVAGYSVTRTRVVIEPRSGAEAEDVRTFFLSSVMGALIHANELLPLHASAVWIGSGCTLLMGAPGSGKSSLAGEFIQRGLELVSDDLTAISLEASGEIRARWGYRTLRLWSDAIPRLAGISGEMRSGRRGHGRQTVVVRGAALCGPLPIRSIYILRLRKEGRVQISPQTGAVKVRALLEQTFRMHLLGALGSPSRHYEACLALARRVPIYEVQRPAGVETLAEIAQVIADREGILGATAIS